MLKFLPKNILPSFLGFIFLFLFSFSFSSFALAYNTAGYNTNTQNGGADSVAWSGEAGTFQAETALGNKDPRVIVASIINITLGFLGILAIVIIMYAGFLWMMSNGDPDKINKAKRVLISGFIGLIIVLSSFAIASFVLDAIFRATTQGSGGGNGGGLPGPSGSSCVLGCAGDPVCIAACSGGGNNNNNLLACSSATNGTCTPDDNLCTQLGPLWTCNPTSCYCEVTNMGSCYNPVADRCNYPCRLGLACLGIGPNCEDDLPVGGCGAGNTSCQCCCDINNDECNLIYPTLFCRADQGNCMGGGRGLCCGCEHDSECNPNACGDDTCCHDRPVATASYPVNNTVDVCTNSMISVTFSQAMKAESLVDNLLLVGEYVGPCPANTHLIDINDPTIVVTNNNGHNFCSVTGSTRVRNIGSNHYVDFIPSDFLDVNTIYHIVVRGDLNVGDDVDEGILNYWGISMGSAGYSSSFTTVDDASEAGGVCVISEVSLAPTYYLFRTAQDSVRENDNNINDPTFDTDDKDGDKLFVATAITANHQFITPMGAYTWVWNWNSSVNTVVTLDTSLYPGDNFAALASAVGGVSDGRSIVSATVQMPVAQTIQDGNGLSDSAEVFVFICDNPWPPIANNGTWRPWEPPTNTYYYDIYYCRDKLPKGTADDLPAFERAGMIPPSSGNILQQVYFSYRISPPPANITSAVNPPVGNPHVSDTGGVIHLVWQPVGAGYSQGVAGYKVYWGTRSGIYPNSEDVGVATDAYITNLTNERPYYFSVTAYTGDRAESSYYDEIAAIPHDTMGTTTAPVFTEVIVSETEVELYWDAVNGAYGYQIVYGLGGNANGATVDVGNYTGVVISPLTPNTMYSFAVAIVDEFGNVGTYSALESTTTLPAL